MYLTILEKIKCPSCSSSLELRDQVGENDEVIRGNLCCSNGHKWYIKDGIIDFNSKEQKIGNNWSELYKKYDYNELDRMIIESIPTIQLEAYNVTLKEIVNEIESRNAKSVLDIATGRGMLLKKLVESFGTSIDLVCVDLSFDVLKYDRIKSIGINPYVKINYIACDATKLPLLDKSFDVAVSFAGITNMGDLASQGVVEGVRVSKEALINTGIVIRDDNPKINQINKHLKESGYDLKIDSNTENNFLNAHKIDDRFKVEVRNVFEGISGINQHDPVPINGEWFGMALSITTRV